MPAAGMPSDQELVYVRVEGFLLTVAIAVVDLGDFGASLVVMSLFLTEGWSGSFCFVSCTTCSFSHTSAPSGIRIMRKRLQATVVFRDLGQAIISNHKGHE